MPAKQWYRPRCACGLPKADGACPGIPAAGVPPCIPKPHRRAASARNAAAKRLRVAVAAER